MCLSVVAKVEKMLGNGEAIVNLRNVRKKINIAFLDDPRIGDWVLIHTGFAIAKVDEEKADQILAAYDKADQMDTLLL